MAVSIRKNGAGQVSIHVPKARISRVQHDLDTLRLIDPDTSENRFWLDAMAYYAEYRRHNHDHQFRARIGETDNE
jgi:hypothetical protein